MEKAKRKLKYFSFINGKEYKEHVTDIVQTKYKIKDREKASNIANNIYHKIFMDRAVIEEIIKAENHYIEEMIYQIELWKNQYENYKNA